MLTSSTPLDARLRAAVRDDATAYRGVAWVRKQFSLCHLDAYQAIVAARRRLGADAVSELQRQWKLTKLLGALASIDEKFPGILRELGNNPHRAVADTRAIDRWEAWNIVTKVRKAMSLSRSSWNDVVVRAIGTRR